MARHPLDMAVSLYHQGDNLDRVRSPSSPVSPPTDPAAPRPSLEVWLDGWIRWEGDPRESLDSLPGVLAHLADAWARR